MCVCARGYAPFVCAVSTHKGSKEEAPKGRRLGPTEAAVAARRMIFRANPFGYIKVSAVIPSVLEDGYRCSVLRSYL